jgi:hypothetical protein
VGKASRGNKSRRSQAASLRGSTPVETLENLQAGGLLEAGMPGRVTYLTDPVLGSMQMAAGVHGGKLIAGDPGTVEPLPVMMFEPGRAVLLENTAAGVVQEGRVEAIVAAGFGRVPPGAVWAVESAPGWQLQRVPGELVLRDTNGDTWASSPVTPDPRWVSAAASYGHVMVLYGPQLGVRRPPSTSPDRYTTGARAAEFRQAREYGLVTAAIVRWQGEPTGETLGWVAFLPGSFAQPLPGIFAPVSVFARHGGPAAFGLSPVQGDASPVSQAGMLTARVTRTDIDLMDPADPELGWIGGVSYPEGIQGTWRRAARRHQQALLLTGPTCPGMPADHRARTAQEELWAGMIALTSPNGAWP